MFSKTRRKAYVNQYQDISPSSVVKRFLLIKASHQVVSEERITTIQTKKNPPPERTLTGE